MTYFYFLCAVVSLVAGIVYLSPSVLRGYNSWRNWRASQSVATKTKRIKQLENYRDILIRFKALDKGVYFYLYPIGLLTMVVIFCTGAILLLHVEPPITAAQIVAVGVYLISMVLGAAIIRYITFATPAGIDKAIKSVESDIVKMTVDNSAPKSETPAKLLS